MTLIVIIIVAIYIILIAWTWQSLGTIEKTKKTAFIFIGSIIMYLLTLIIFNISKNGVDYQNINVQGAVRNILVAIFTGINGIVTMPQLAKILEKINENEIDKKIASRRFLIIAIIFIICIIFECGYMKDTQKGILNIYNSMK